MFRRLSQLSCVSIFLLSTDQTQAVIDAAVAEWMKQTCIAFEKHDYYETFEEQHLHFIDYGE